MKEYIFEKPEGLYMRILDENSARAYQAGENLGWKMIEGDLETSEAIRICEEHNKPILDLRIKLAED